jgi:hypothetical protein
MRSPNMKVSFSAVRSRTRQALADLEQPPDRP